RRLRRLSAVSARRDRVPLHAGGGGRLPPWQQDLHLEPRRFALLRCRRAARPGRASQAPHPISLDHLLLARIGRLAAAGGAGSTFPLIPRRKKKFSAFPRCVVSIAMRFPLILLRRGRRNFSQCAEL